MDQKIDTTGYEVAVRWRDECLKLRKVNEQMLEALKLGVRGVEELMAAYRELHGGELEVSTFVKRALDAIRTAEGE